MGAETLSRRGFVAAIAAGAAGLAIGFRLDGAAAQQAAPVGPLMLRSNPRLDSWVRITPDGRITVLTGRVELGQGVLTGMRQIAAEELDVAPGRWR